MSGKTNLGYDNEGATSYKVSNGKTDITTSGGRKKGWFRRTNIIVLVFLILISITLVLVFTLALKKDKELSSETLISPNRRFTLDEVFLRKYTPRTASIYWVSDDNYLDFSDGIVRKSITNSTYSDRILTRQEMVDNRISRSLARLSPDNKWVLLANNTKKLYRHSFYADYYVKERSTNRVIKLHSPDGDSDEQIRLCTWANNGSAIVFVYKCNVYYIATLETEDIKYYQLTTSGVPKSVFNGVPDWVYEEELLFSGKALEVSADGKYLSYVKFNANQSYFSYAIYGHPSKSYPDIDRIAYPKAGFPNPTIEIKIINLQSVLQEDNSVKNFTQYKKILSPPAKISKGDYYYCIMTWSPGNELYVQWMNRAQNETVCMKYDSTNGQPTTLQEYNTPGGWIDDDYTKPKFAKDNSNYITLLPHEDFRHLAKVSMNPKNGPEVEFLTDGKFMVVDINCYNADDQILYYRSTQESPAQRHVYRINLQTKENSCITCDLLKDSDGTKCTYHDIVFSKKCTYATINCKGPYVPVSYMVNMETMNVQNLTSNEHVKDLLSRKALPTEKFYTIKSDGWDIHVKETRPAGFDPKKKYPVLLSVYGGPSTQKVTDRYSYGFDHFLVSSHDIILINFDARGAGYYGYKFMYAVYKQLGHYEAVDAVNVGKYLKTQPYVDPKKIAIWGWSYGGFYSSTVMGMDSDVITTAVAVAPVTDWRYYDTVYTERYMGLPTPEDNIAGYQVSRVAQSGRSHIILLTFVYKTELTKLNLKVMSKFS
uniref:Uncharacterized protein n=1 Tax=Clytia hemisphaerica TaxID=252671 RepID=A0A7M6DQ17_9CNID